MMNLIKKAQEIINLLEGQNITYMCSQCKVENGYIYDLEQNEPNHIDLYAMNKELLEELIKELEPQLLDYCVSEINELMEKEISLNVLNSKMQKILNTETDIFDYGREYWENFCWETSNNTGVAIGFTIINNDEENDTKIIVKINDCFTV